MSIHVALNKSNVPVVILFLNYVISFILKFLLEYLIYQDGHHFEILVSGFPSSLNISRENILTKYDTSVGTYTLSAKYRTMIIADLRIAKPYCLTVFYYQFLHLLCTNYFRPLTKDTPVVLHRDWMSLTVRFLFESILYFMRKLMFKITC